MKRTALALILAVPCLMAFGVPDVPDVPDVEVPDIEIPGMEILDDLQVQLDQLMASTDSLVWLIPELTALEDVSAKLEELRETDPDVVGLQEELDALRGELVTARAELEEISDVLTEDVEELHSSLQTFREGLPTALQ